MGKPFERLKTLKVVGLNEIKVENEVEVEVGRRVNPLSGCKPSKWFYRIRCSCYYLKMSVLFSLFEITFKSEREPYKRIDKVG